MLKVRCPECNQITEITNGKCKNCNYDIINFMKNNDLIYNEDIAIKQTFICPHCGTIDAGDSIRLKCPECGTIYKAIELTRDDYWSGVYIGEKEKILLKTYVGNTIDWYLYNERETKYTTQTPKQQNTPKCPTCGSTNIQKISATKKAVGALGFGLLSKTARSQFECKNCGYKW